MKPHIQSWCNKHGVIIILFSECREVVILVNNGKFSHLSAKLGTGNSKNALKSKRLNNHRRIQNIIQ